MKKLIESLYLGNLCPISRVTKKNGEYQKALHIISSNEEKMLTLLNADEKKLLSELIEAYGALDTIIATENFTMGFRLGAKMLIECFDDNDGNFIAP